MFGYRLPFLEATMSGFISSNGDSVRDFTSRYKLGLRNTICGAIKVRKLQLLYGVTLQPNTGISPERNYTMVLLP